ncbi:MAG: hypothetical protein ABWZ86_01500, partial [Hyphomicrobium sp.]
LAASCFAGPSASAGWFSSIVRESSEVVRGTAGRAGRAVELAPLRSAAAYLDKLESAPKGTLAAHATAEGHWQFVNRDGQTFTVGTPDEMTRVLPALVPDMPANGERKMTLYLSEDSVFANRDALGELPKDADLNVVADGTAYRLARSGQGSDLTLKAFLSPNLAMELRDRAAFEETAYLLGRPLNTSNIRTIAFEPGSAPLSSAPKFDPDTRSPLVDQLDPDKLATGLRPLRGQTALVTGQVSDGKLIVAPSSGAELSLPLDDLVAAARDNNVNLVILRSDSTRQAGGRNWLWQKIRIGGLDGAITNKTFGDFLDALAARRGGFLLNASHEATGRVRIAAVPDSAGAGISADASNVLGDLVSHVTGEVVTNAVSIDARDRDTQTEHDIRLIPWLPAAIQYLYLGAIVIGIAGWSMARNWWRKLTQAEDPGTPVSSLRLPRRIISELVFLLVFLPIVGLPAFTVQTLHQLIQTILAPFRWIRRRFLLKHV